MKFSEIANRLTGISTPFGGASWQPAEREIAAARRIIVFLEDRPRSLRTRGDGSRLSLRPIGDRNSASSQR